MKDNVDKKRIRTQKCPSEMNERSVKYVPTSGRLNSNAEEIRPLRGSDNSTSVLASLMSNPYFQQQFIEQRGGHLFNATSSGLCQQRPPSNTSGGEQMPNMTINSSSEPMHFTSNLYGRLEGHPTDHSMSSKNIAPRTMDDYASDARNLILMNVCNDVRKEDSTSSTMIPESPAPIIFSNINGMLVPISSSSPTIQVIVVNNYSSPISTGYTPVPINSNLYDSSRLCPIAPAPSQTASAVVPAGQSDQNSRSSLVPQLSNLRRTYRCDHDNCNKTYFKNSHLKVHQRIHTGNYFFKLFLVLMETEG